VIVDTEAIPCAEITAPARLSQLSGRDSVDIATDPTEHRSSRPITEELADQRSRYFTRTACEIIHGLKSLLVVESEMVIVCAPDSRWDQTSRE